MKGIPFVKPPDARWGLLGMVVLLVGVYGYFGVRYYTKYNDYQQLESGTPSAGQNQPVLLAPYAAYELKDLHHNIFADRAAQTRPTPKQPQKVSYQVLGVVQKDHLYVVIKFPQQKKYALFKEKARIDQNCLIKEITLEKVIIREFNRDRVYKIFKFLPEII